MSGGGGRGMFIKSKFLGPLFTTTPPSGTVSGFLLNCLDFMEKRASTTKIEKYFREYRNCDLNSHIPPTYPSPYKERGEGESKRPNKLTLNCRVKVGILYRSVIIIVPSLKLFWSTKEGERDLGS